MRDRVVATGRGDHARQRRRLVGLELGRAGPPLVGLAARVIAPEVRARGGFDAVRAGAEVDRVQVVAQDPLLGPLARQVVGERRLPQLREQRAVVLGGGGVLDELLGDRGTALDRALLEDVLVERAADAAQVVALVGVEAPVLDRDDRVLHHRRDLGLGDVQLALVAGQQPDLAPVGVEDHRVALQRVLQLGQVGGDRHHHPEHGRDGGQRAQAQEQGEHAQLADPHRGAGRLAAVARRPAPQRQVQHLRPVPVPAAVRLAFLEGSRIGGSVGFAHEWGGDPPKAIPARCCYPRRQRAHRTGGPGPRGRRD